MDVLQIVTMLAALIVPEFLLVWAVCQRSKAKEIAAQYNSKLFGHRDEKKENDWWKELWTKLADRFFFWKKILDWFYPLPKETTHHGAGKAWTTTHGFFIQMGGFILYSDSYPVEVLTYELLASLLEQKIIDAPTVTERELQDRSKGDWLSKGVIVLQTTWFVVQCIARAIRRLPLSELEVLTLAFAALNGAIYAAWWDKPQGVDTAICVPLKTVASAGQSDSEPFIPPHHNGDLRVPTFNIDTPLHTTNMIISITAGTLFGAVHLLAWSSEFASTRDLVLWRVSAVITTVTFVFGVLSGLTEASGSFPWILYAISWYLYYPGRVALIFVAFDSLRNTPPGVLVDIPWTSYLPHF